MATDHPTGCEDRGPSLPIEEDAKVERVVLSYLLDAHPSQLTVPELSRALNDNPGGFAREDAVERAVRDLVGAGLLHCRGGFAVPTRATLYLASLWEL